MQNKQIETNIYSLLNFVQHFIDSTIGNSLFKILYNRDPIFSIDLVYHVESKKHELRYLLDIQETWHKVQENVHQNIEIDKLNTQNILIKNILI